MRPLLPVVVVGVLLAAPPPASAEEAAATPAPPAAPAPIRLAVVPLDAPDDLAVIGRGLAEAVAQELARTSGLEVLGPSEVVRQLGPDAARRAGTCGENVACLVGPGEQLGAQRVLGGWLAKAGTTYRFGLVLADVPGRAALGRVTRQVPIASRRLRGDMVAAAGPLVRGEAEGTGTLAVLTEAPGAEVRIDDRPAGRTPLEIGLPAGKHRLEVSQPGKMRVEPLWVDVPAGGRVEQQVRLFDIPVSQRRPGEVETTVDVGRARHR